MTLDKGTRVYYRGRHYTVIANGEKHGREAVQILPDGRTKPHPTQWITVRALEAAHAVYSGA